MMGERTAMQEALFYDFSAWIATCRRITCCGAIDRFVDLRGVRAHLAPFYSDVGRPSIDPELMIRMLLVGYCFGIRSERRLCEEVHLNLAYRWFCRLGLDGERAGPLDLLEEPPRPLPRQRSVASVCSRRVRRAAAWPKGWWAAKASRSTPA